MSKSRFQFGVRGLLVVTLAISCFFGGWAAHHRRVESAVADLKKALVETQKRFEVTILEYRTEIGPLRAENQNLIHQIEVLERMVELRDAEIEEINAVMDRPGSS